jgi:putative membrane protein
MLTAISQGKLQQAGTVRQVPTEPRAIDEPPRAPEPRRFDQDGDASRRTWLASERTVLAWLRTGLTATAVALAVGKVVPDLRESGAEWPFIVLGAGYGILGVAIVAYGLWRGREIDRAIRAGEWLPPDDRAMWIIGALAIGLGLLAAVVIVAI